MAKEDGVLKLVHPGGFVEIHRRPVVASQVMARNPRHFVTRPDVFKFPWIVVRPESLLKPGNVFFIVPYHTLYRLLRPSNPTPRPPPIHPHHEDSRSNIYFPKPCLKNPARGGFKSQDRRVMFDLPEDDRDGRRRLEESILMVAGNL